MPLRDNDIVIDQIVSTNLQTAQGRSVRGLQYRFTVRGHGPFHAEFPEEKFDVNYAYQQIMKQAADQVELLERFGLRE